MTKYQCWCETSVALFANTDDVIFTFDVFSDVISRFPHVHTFFEAKMDAEQRYAIKYLVRKKKTRHETLWN